MMAAQQAQQDAAVASQQAMQANQQVMQNAQQASQDVNLSGPWQYVRKPKPSLKAGLYTSPQTLKITDIPRGAAVYYTTNGWTPTPLSKQYDGPIQLKSTTHLQMIAIIPFYGRSEVVDAVYTFPPSPQPPDAAIHTTNDGTLTQGTSVDLVVTAPVDSKTAEVGDEVPLAMTENIVLGNRIITPKEVVARGKIVHVDHTGAGGAPGVLTLRVDWLKVDGVTVPLTAFETIEGKNHVGRVKSLIFIPVVGLAGLAQHGDNAEISPGMRIVARVASDTSLMPKS